MSNGHPDTNADTSTVGSEYCRMQSYYGIARGYPYQSYHTYCQKCRYNHLVRRLLCLPNSGRAVKDKFSNPITAGIHSET